MKRTLGVSIVLLALAVLAPPAYAAAAVALPEKSVEALLFLRHPRGLNRFVRAVSDPTSPHYRQYANVATLVNRFGASEVDQEQTLAWLERQGLHGTVGPTGTYVTAPIAPWRADRLLPRPASSSSSSTQGALGREVPAALRGPVTGVGVLGNRRVFKNVTAAPSAGPTGQNQQLQLDPHPQRHRERLPRRPQRRDRRSARTIHAEPVPHRLRARRDARPRPARPGRDHGRGRDRRLPPQRHRDLRQVLRAEDPADPRRPGQPADQALPAGD